MSPLCLNLAFILWRHLKMWRLEQPYRSFLPRTQMWPTTQSGFPTHSTFSLCPRIFPSLVSSFLVLFLSGSSISEDSSISLNSFCLNDIAFSCYLKVSLCLQFSQLVQQYIYPLVLNCGLTDIWGWIILFCGAVLCIGWYLGASLASPHLMLVAPPKL